MQYQLWGLGSGKLIAPQILNSSNFFLIHFETSKTSLSLNHGLFCLHFFEFQSLYIYDKFDLNFVPVVSRVPSANPDQQKDDRSSDLRNHAAHRGDEDVRLKSSSQDEDHDEPHPGDQPTESACGSSSSSPLVHKEPWQRSSASARRALFARRRLDASASQTSHFQTQNPQRGLSPPHTPSPKPSQPPSPPASLPSGFHQTPGSPARGPPSNQIQGPSDPQYGACPRPREHPSASTQVGPQPQSQQANIDAWAETKAAGLSERKSLFCVFHQSNLHLSAEMRITKPTIPKKHPNSDPPVQKTACLNSSCWQNSAKLKYFSF